MQYLIGFALGCVFTSIAMCRFATNFAGEAINKLMVELTKILKRPEEE